MREIKFRVWNGEQMISPDYIDRNGTVHWKENSIPELSKDIMQYTGLTDKNGKEIYEGDIIDFMPAGRYTVVYVDDMGHYKAVAIVDNVEYSISAFNFKNGVVAGNIHESQELIND